MGLRKDKNVAMLFSKVSKRRCQKIKINVWDKARETLDLTQSVDYTNVRGKHMALTQNMCDTANLRIQLG
jgi:hypothetical protein